MSLNRALHHGEWVPQWAVFDDERRYERFDGKDGQPDDVAKREGLHLLDSATGCFAAEMKRCRAYLDDYHASGSTPLADGSEAGPLRQLSFLVPYTRFRKVGFDREQLVDFLDEHGIPHALPSTPRPPQTSQKEWTEKLKKEIYEEACSRVPQVELAKKHGVNHRQQISQIINDYADDNDLPKPWQKKTRR